MRFGAPGVVMSQRRDRSAESGPGGPRRGGSHGSGPRRGGPQRRGGRTGSGPRPSGGSVRRPGSLYRLKPIGPGRYVLQPPSKLEQLRPELEDGYTLWREGDPEAAQETFRFALEQFNDAIEIHVALGRLASEALEEPDLARAHLTRACDLIGRMIPTRFDGHLPRDHPANAPIFDAFEGAAASLDATEPALAQRYRDRARRLAGPRPGRL